ncbi:MAG: ABC transporter permease [Bacteroidales bacterium]|nr:MAG: ABC transporter permease [Bacteroidales bacterium]
MIYRYLIIAFRSLVKNKLFSVIHFAGLAIGMSTGLILLSYVHSERSYDRFYPAYERIYRLRYERTSADGESVRFASCCPPAGLRIRERYPDVEQVARIYRFPVLITYEQNRFLEERVFFAEPEIFEIFKWPFTEGDPVNGIREPNTAFLSQSAAHKYFGDENPVGKSIRVDQKTEYMVTGIYEDMPENSHLKCDIFLSYPNLVSMFGDWIEEAWGYTGFFTYLRLREGADPGVFAGRLPALVDAEFGETLKSYNLTCELPLQPLADIHLTSHFMQEYEVNGNRDTVNFLLIIALLVLLIAWINYINLTTARSLTKVKEVSMHKVAGSSRLALITRFYIETIILNFFALVASLILIKYLLPVFSELTMTPFEEQIMHQTWFWIILGVLFVSGILLSGLYPAIILTSFKPIVFLRGIKGSYTRGINLRRSLVVFQFLLSIILITWTLAIFGQIRFMRNQELNINIKRIAVLRAPRVFDKLYPARVVTFKEEMRKIPGIEQACFITEVPGKQIFWDNGGIYRVGSDESKNYQIVGIDYEFPEVFEVEFVAGRSYSRDFPSDSAALVLNETAVRWMGFPDPESALSGRVDYWGVIYNIIGVMKDYHQQSPKQAFEPHIYRLMPDGWGQRGHFAMKIKEENPGRTLEEVRDLFDSFFPDNSFDYFMLETYYNQQYKGDKLLGNIVAIFAILAILVTVLGILGLTTFMIIQRTREFSIRIILGARPGQIFALFTREFLQMIFIAMLISVPVCLFGLRYWLESFTERMDLTVWIFIIPFLIAFLTTGITITGLVVKASMTNAAENLRYE